MDNRLDIPESVTKTGDLLSNVPNHLAINSGHSAKAVRKSNLPHFQKPSYVIEAC